jgi:hypothetical protein
MHEINGHSPFDIPDSLGQMNEGVFNHPVHLSRRDLMERRAVKFWYDPEGDFMEVIFDEKAGYFRETDDERVMEKVDADGNFLGFSVMNVSSLKGKPFEVALA